jgi:hypothetical protein
VERDGSGGWVQSELPPQSAEVGGLAPASARPGQGSEEPGGILGRPEQVRRLAQAGEFVGRDEGHIFVAPAVDQGGLAGAFDLVPQGGEVLACAAIADLDGHVGLRLFLYR